MSLFYTCFAMQSRVVVATESSIILYEWMITVQLVFFYMTMYNLKFYCKICICNLCWYAFNRNMWNFNVRRSISVKLFFYRYFKTVLLAEFFVCTLLHLSPDTEVMWCIVITCRLSSSLSPWSLSVNILIFFSDTTGPIGTKLGRNVNWIVLWQVWPKIHKRNKMSKCVKKGVVCF